MRDSPFVRKHIARTIETILAILYTDIMIVVIVEVTTDSFHGKTPHTVVEVEEELSQGILLVDEMVVIVIIVLLNFTMWHQFLLKTSAFVIAVFVGRQLSLS